jgi:alpha,alpha-trehalose phosphorylase
MNIAAVIFDMDGVVTRTAELHAAAWKTLFDEILLKHAARSGTPFRPFDIRADYLTYVDGRPRYEGVRSFLAAREIELADGDPSDATDVETLHGLAARKDALFAQALQREGVQVYASTLALIYALRAQAIRTGVVTSSRHGRQILHSAAIETLFDSRLDGIDLETRELKGKPDPDAFLACAKELAAPPIRSVLIEDAIAGVQAGRRGGFGLIVGVDRGGNRAALASHGADVVVADLGELGVADLVARLRQGQASIAWRIEQEGFDSSREHEMESIFAVGNGYLGVRGAPDTPLGGSLDQMFVAGIYDHTQAAQPHPQREFRTADGGGFSKLVSLPSPFRLRLHAADDPLEIRPDRSHAYRRVLDLRNGVLETHLLLNNDGRRTDLHTRRCASLTDMHLLLQEITIELENHSGTVELDSSLLDPRVAVRHPHVELVPSPCDQLDTELLYFRTKSSQLNIALASRTTLVGSEHDASNWRISAHIGEKLIFRRMVTVYTSRDATDPAASALAHLRQLQWSQFEALLAAHTEQWDNVWKRADVRVSDRPAIEQALRFNAYHLRSAADHDSRVSIGARTLSGPGYEGHVFWDVEIFILPFFLHTFPELAEHLLQYRYRTLDGARHKAQKLGYRGACYAWESTVTGEDVTPRSIVMQTSGNEIPIFNGTEEIHVTADVAFAVWQYWAATTDREFLRRAGVEILAETARFWASRCTPSAGSYHIHGVVGPDEYHYTVSDNAYTNWLARFNLEKAAWAIDWLKQEFHQDFQALVERLGLASAEPDEWARIARELYLPQPNSDGVIEQFSGFFALPEYSLRKEDRLAVPVNRLFDWEQINRLQLVKQADVLMLLYLFPELFSQEVVLANYRYYEPRTDHGSSLSPAIHAAIAARLGLRADAERYWRQSLALDLSNTMGNSSLGVHAACMGATWQALVFGFLGVCFTEQGPIAAADAAARLPEEWRSVALNLAWRGKLYPVEVQR